MRLKDDTVSITGMTPGLLFGLMVADGIYRAHGAELIITSVNDAKHSQTSLHYSGNAADLRSWDLDNPHGVASEIKQALGVDFDVIKETDHIHLEYQPRRR